MNTERAALLARAVAQEDGKHHDQESWFRLGTATAEYELEMPAQDLLELKCGTAGCAAGWAAAMARPSWYLVNGGSIAPPVAGYPGAVAHGARVPVDAVAREWLELTEEQADWLFAAYRSREEVLWALLGPAAWLPEDWYR